MTLAAYIGPLPDRPRHQPWVALGDRRRRRRRRLGGLPPRPAWRPWCGAARRAFAIVIVTVSAGVVLQYVIVAVAGPDTQSYGEQSGQTFHFLGLILTASQVTIIALARRLMLALHLLLTRTTLGRAMRATASNRVLAQSCGIDTDRVSDVAWMLSGALCGAAGVALAITTVSFDFTLGAVFLIPMIAAAVLGGDRPTLRSDGRRSGGWVASELAAAYTQPRLPRGRRLRNPDRHPPHPPQGLVRCGLGDPKADGLRSRPGGP